jgi:hypothetical protein
MSQDPENLLEVDRIDEVLEAPESPQTVVVVQYRTARLPWVLLIGAILIIPLIGYVIYYRTNQGLRDRATWVVRAELERWAEQKRLEAERRAPIRPEPPIALAANTATVVQAPGATVSAAGNTGSDPPKVEAIATKPVESPAAGRPSTVEGAAPGPAGAPSSPALAAAVPAVSPPRPVPGGTDPAAVVKASAVAVRSPFSELDSSDPDPAEAPFGGTASTTAALAQPSPAANLSGANPPKTETAPERVQPAVGAQPVTVASPAPPSQPIAVPAEPPLPSREETERQIQEEAELRRAERAREIEEKQAEDRRIQYEERARFHQELKEALAQGGDLAVMAIEQLCQKANFRANPETFARARAAWKRRVPLANRVQMMRSLDLPESMILNLLSADLDPLIHTRGGPRNRNEVRLKAARTLLSKCALPSLEEATRLPAKPGQQSAPSANPRPGTSAPRAAALPR